MVVVEGGVAVEGGWGAVWVVTGGRKEGKEGVSEESMKGGGDSGGDSGERERREEETDPVWGLCWAMVHPGSVCKDARL